MWVTPHVISAKADLVQHHHGALRDLCGIAQTVNLQGFADNALDGQARVQRRVRVLKHKLHTPSQFT